MDLPPSHLGFKPAIDTLRTLFENLAVELPDKKDIMDTGTRTVDYVARLFYAAAAERPRTRAETNFWEKVVLDPPHAIWTGMGGDRPQTNWTAYGRKVRTSASRIMWLLRRGEDVPDNSYLKKLCDRSRCISDECHRPTSDRQTPSVRVRRDVIYGSSGLAMCARNGHILRSAPRPGEKMYCPACHALDAQEKRRNDAIRQQLEPGSARPTQPTWVIRRPEPEDDPEPEPTRPAPRPSQQNDSRKGRTATRSEKEAVMAMMDEQLVDDNA